MRRFLRTYGGTVNTKKEAPSVPQGNTLYADLIPKAWVTWTLSTGNSPVIADDVNVSTITKGGTGLYTVNFATQLGNANYTAIPSLYTANANRTAMIVSPGTSSFAIQISTVSGVAKDEPGAVVVFGRQ